MPTLASHFQFGRKAHLPRSLLLLLLVLVGLVGCASPVSQNDPAYRGPFYTPRNVSREEAMPAGIRRVLLLPVSVGEVAPVETAKTLDRAMVVALQNEQRFEVVVFTREECSWAFGREEFSSVDALPHGFLEKLAATYAVDAVIFVDLTAYQAYRPQAIGLRSKLATVRDVRLVWSFDEIISATDPAVANSVRRQYLKNDRGTQPLDLSPAALQSPSRFAAFAAQAMFRTLPPR